LEYDVPVAAADMAHGIRVVAVDPSGLEVQVGGENSLREEVVVVVLERAVVVDAADLEAVRVVPDVTVADAEDMVFLVSAAETCREEVRLEELPSGPFL
jgi:hypothetical protein